MTEKMENIVNSAHSGTGQLDQVHRVRVWDLFVRLFHWLLVVLVSVTALTGFLGEEWWLDYHVWAGYAIAALLVLRLIWGFAGSPYARFSSFVFSARETLGFVWDLVRGRPGHYTGHNPAGALMVFALLAVLTALTVSGIVLLGGQENQGLLAGVVSYATGAFMRDIHEWLAWGLLGMIGAHIGGVLLEGYLSRENLVRAMVTGYKKAAPQHDAGYAKFRSALVALLAVVVIGFVGGGASWTLARIPASGLVSMPENPNYASECGDCHHAYHPSLLPEPSWKKVMTGLEDHFGEDASLDEDTVKEISRYLQTYASEKWDTEAANNLRLVSRKNPLAITASAYWKTRHSDIEEQVFARKKIGSKGNCIACHKDAASGRFDDQQINIPE